MNWLRWAHLLVVDLDTVAKEEMAKVIELVEMSMLELLQVFLQLTMIIILV